MKINNGGPAFPFAIELDFSERTHGMTLRDYFAAKAMVGYLSNSQIFKRCLDIAEHDSDYGGDEDNVIARHCYCLADAMLKEKNRCL